MTTPDTLFEPVQIGPMELRNRIVMAPMTRNRATVNGVPSELAVTFYAQRAGAGLIITEGTQPSPGGQGYPRTPGIHASEQVAAWRKVTNAVHARQGRIVLQLMHAGRIVHRANRLIDAAPVAPSAIPAAGEMYTDAFGKQPHSLPRALEIEEIRSVVDEYRQATANALLAGFDGVELHAANGYLPMQFLSSNSNQRTDRYGGSIENRARFVIETLEAMIEAAGSAARVGIRVSPDTTFNDMHDEDRVGTYLHLIQALNRFGLGYLHVQRSPGLLPPAKAFDPIALLRPYFTGPLMATGGFDHDSGARLVANGGADLIGYASFFIGNPDLVERFRRGAPLAPSNPETFYTPGAQGYIDYPQWAETPFIESYKDSQETEATAFWRDQVRA
jgi:N-ethylmaleimide reductase